MNKLRHLGKQWVLLGAIFIVGTVVGIFGNRFFYAGDASSLNDLQIEALREKGYQFVSPLLAADTNFPEGPQLKPLQDKLKLETYDFLNDPRIHTLSVYFRDLSSSQWTGINEDFNYDPASLLKIPVMIAWFKKAEADPSLLSQTLLYEGSSGVTRGEEFYGLHPNTRYTVDDLIRKMITQSDNAAKDLLITSLDKKSLNKVFSDLNIEILGDDLNSQYQISAKAYSLFFRILYNATYLDPELSKKALRLLSETDYNEGLVAGIPLHVTVSHKFGQYGAFNQSSALSAIEFHDCGIVYHPSHPYLLCVMTRGDASTPLNLLQQEVAKVSRLVYEEVDSEYR